jgi:hypothetical protein
MMRKDIAMKTLFLLSTAVLAVTLAGCASSTNNGLPYAGQQMPTLPQYVGVPQPVPLRPTPRPIVQAPRISKPALPSIREENIPLQSSLSAEPSLPTVSTVTSQAHKEIAKAGAAISSSNFAHTWTGDLQSARQQSTACVGETGAQRSACWQGVAAWSQARAAAYGKAQSLLTGAQAQQAGAAQKFFQTTSQWADACSSLSAADCGKSPLIAKMQQWKSSVGIAAPSSN